MLIQTSTGYRHVSLYGCQLRRRPYVWMAQKIRVPAPVFGRHTADSPPPDGTRHSAASGCFRTPATACPAGEDQMYPVAVREDDSAVLLSTRSVAFFPQDGQARLPHELSGTLRADSPGYHPNSFTPSIRVPQASILATASTSISRRPPASGRTSSTGWL